MATTGAAHHVGIAPQIAELPDGRVVTIRAGSRDDLDGLTALYAGLSDEDTYLRFFSAHRPDAGLFERMVTLEEHGGALLVVEAEVDGVRTIVGDAWYSLLPNGDGELAITVEAGWRGWLGGHLLDALLDVAATNQVPNLEAEIMLRNRPMMGLARRRGCVRMADDGIATRVAIATRGGVPSWPPLDVNRRVLVEGRREWHAHDVAARRGLSVLVCPGPSADPDRCPAISGGTCPLVDGADAIVVGLSPGDDQVRGLIRSHRARHADIPVIAEAGPTVSVDEGVERIDPLADETEVVDLVIRAIAEADERALRDGTSSADAGES